MIASGAADRTLIVFISSPGDVSEERARAQAVLEQLDSRVRHVGIRLITWRHERDATPRVGDGAQDVVTHQLPSYDIYVGILARRLGTPTRSARSGTLEEFNDACSRRSASGSPEIFFYFGECEENGAGEQAQQVRQFRAEYPGLYRRFSDSEEFGSLLQEDLLLFLFRDVLGRDRIRISHEMRWPKKARGARDLLDQSSAINPQSYLDCSSATIDRRLNRLAAALDLTALRAEEREALVAGITWLSAPHVADRMYELLSGYGSDRELVRDLLDELRMDEPSTSLGRRDECVVKLASLARIACLLDRDRAAIAPSHVGRQPPGDSSLEEWLHYLTRDIRIDRGGFVQFVLEVPSETWVDALKSATSFHLETLWQQYRRALASSKISITVQPSEVILRPDLRVPGQVLKQLGLTRRPLFADLSHFGEAEAVPDIASLLPCPETSMGESMSFTASNFAFRRLCVFKVGAPQEVVCERVAEEGETLMLPATDLAPDNTYGWRLFRRARTGEEVEIRAGTIRCLAREARQILETLQASDPSIYRRISLALRADRDLLVDTWSRLVEGQATRDEALWVFGRLMDGFHDTDVAHRHLLTQLEGYRNAAAYCWQHFCIGESS